MKFLSSYGFIVYALKKSVQFIVADSERTQEKKYERRSLRYPSILWERNVARREDDMEGPDALQDAEKGGGEKSSGYVGTMDGCTDEYKWSKL